MSGTVSIKGCIALACLVLLAACGGGGGGGGTESTLTPYTVSVAVTGLNGTVTLQNNGGNNLSVSVNGSATFSATLIAGAAYKVTVLTHSTGQSCNVVGGSGNMPASNISIPVNCGNNTIGVTVSGLNGTVVLQNNGGNNLSISTNGVFSFSSVPNFGAGYNVAVLTRPVGQNCSIGNGSGSISGAVNVTVNCVGFAPPAPTVAVAPGTKQLGFSWASDVDTAFYHVLQNPDGLSGYSQLGGNFAATNYTLDLSDALLHTRMNALYIVEACNNFGCTGSTPVALATQIIKAIGYFKASNTTLGDGLGWAVALSADGSTLAVGVRGEDSAATGINNTNPGPGDNTADESGAVYVFVRSGGAWSQQAYIKASNAERTDQFGYAVALSNDGNTLAVGAAFESSATSGVSAVGPTPAGDDDSAFGAGAVYIFTRLGTTWTQQAYIKASNPDSEDTFGSAVALSGDGNTLAVGAPFEDSLTTGVNPVTGQADNSLPFAGAVYVFTRSGSVWSQQAYIKASNTDAQDQFGYAVALSGDSNTLAVGAFRESSAATGINNTPGQADNTAMFAGAVYVFSRSVGVWSQQAYIKASNTNADDAFGFSVALSADGNTLAVGAVGEDSGATGVNNVAPGQSDNSVSFSGAVYVFTRSGNTWTQQAYVKASNTGASDQFGYAVALSSDGSTLAVGANNELSAATGINNTNPGQGDNSLSGSGAVYLLTRTSGAWSQQAYIKASNTGGSDSFGTGVALSGDGKTLAVGANGESSAATGIGGNQADNSAAGAGAVYLY